MFPITPDVKVSPLTSSSSPESASLPLDWTCVQRRTRQNEQCCEDSTTCGLRHGRQQLRPSLDRLRLVRQDDSSSETKVVKGYAVFCLHEIDPAWFQGYFVPEGSRQPWGLLAVQEEVDECLACADGGFRRIRMTIYKRGSNSAADKPIKLDSVDWTGGDMIQLRHSKLEMEADKMWMGNSCLSHIDQYFKGLMSKLRHEYGAARDIPILEWLPDVAVVAGEMTVVI